MIESLRYLCNMRLNLAFSVNTLSKFMERLKVSHLAAVKRILRYIKGSIGCGILFPAADTGNKYNLLGFTNCNCGRDKDDQKSIAGYIFLFCKTLIS